jgi:hypothetical protein
MLSGTKVSSNNLLTLCVRNTVQVFQTALHFLVFSLYFGIVLSCLTPGFLNVLIPDLRRTSLSNCGIKEGSFRYPLLLSAVMDNPIAKATVPIRNQA